MFSLPGTFRPDAEVAIAERLGEVAVLFVDLSVMGDNAPVGTLTRGFDSFFFSRRGSRTGQGGAPVVGSMSAEFGANPLLATLSPDDIGAHPAG